MIAYPSEYILPPEVRIEAIRESIGQLVEHPFGGDPKAALSAAGFLLFSDSNPSLIELIDKTMQTRELSLPEAVAMMTMHIPNFLHLSMGNVNYAEGLVDPESWARVYEQNINAPLWQEAMSNYHIQTNIYNRTATGPFTISRVFPHKKVNVIDIGCGANLANARMLWNGQKNSIAPYHIQLQGFDQELHDEIMCAMWHSSPVAHGIGVDLSDPIATNPQWWMANRHISNMRNAYQDLELAYLLRTHPELEFTQRDATRDPLPDGDLGTASTMMYQLTEQHQQMLYQKMADQYELIYIQDYVEIIDGKPVFNQQRGSESYRTIIQTNKGIFELFRFSSSQCEIAYPGSDLNDFLSAYPTNSCNSHNHTI